MAHVSQKPVEMLPLSQWRSLTPNFYFAKNKQCDPSIQAYVDGIIKILQKNKPEFIPKFFLMNFMEKCVEGVRDRIRKWHKALEELEELGIPLDLLSGNFFCKCI